MARSAEVDSGAEAGHGAPDLGRIDFGIVNYNGGPSLLRCVRSILAQEPGPECRVWVFDNGSSDGSADRVERAHPDVTVIRSRQNLGYAGALNALAERMRSDVVVLSNMDLEFDPGWAAAVARAWRREPGAAAVATVVVERTDPPVLNSLGVRFWGDLHAQNVGSGEVYDPDAVEARRERAFGSYGAVMCLRRRAVREVGFDADYFLFFEETDFFLRFWLLGHRTAFSADAVCRHERSRSTRRYSPLKLYYGERNRLTTVFKLLPVWYWPVAMVHTLRRLALLARQTGGGSEGLEEGDTVEPTPLPSRTLIIRTLLKAWAGAVWRLPRTLAARRRFWRGAPATPRDALALLRSYRLSAGELRLR